MLQRLAQNVEACLAHASEADARASRATEPRLRIEYSELARSWRHLARSYQCVETLERFLLDARKYTPPVVPAASDEPKVPNVCPACGKAMRFASLEPDPHYASLDRQRFVCDCGHRTNNFVAR